MSSLNCQLSPAFVNVFTNWAMNNPKPDIKKPTSTIRLYVKVGNRNGMNGETNLMLRICLPLWRFSSRVFIGVYARCTRSPNILLRHSHGAVTVKHHALCDDQAGGVNIAVYSSWRCELDPLRGCHVTLYAPLFHYDLASHLFS